MTVVVAVVAVLFAAVLALRGTARDIFPNVGTPTIYVAQPFGGMDPAQMEGYLTYYYEYHFLYITGIEHIESKSIQGNALIKLQFYPGHGAGDGRDGFLRQSRPRLYAPRNRAALRDAFRRRQRPGGQPRLREQHPLRRRDAGRGLESGSAALCDAARSVGAATVRRQRAHDIDQCEA